MKVALTYDLQDHYLQQGYSKEEVAEFDKQDTVDTLAVTIEKAGDYKVEKIGSLKQLITKLSKGYTCDLVFNIAEGMYGLGRESAIPCILEAYQIPYTFSDPSVLAICLHKGITKKLLKQFAIHTADFEVIHSIDELSKVKLPFPLFAKPVAEGTGKGISYKSIINSHKELTNLTSNLLTKFSQPVLVETYLPGREFTVGIIGTGDQASTIGVMELSFKDNNCNGIYCHETKTINYNEKVTYSLLEDDDLADRISTMCLEAWKKLNCRDAGRIDVKLDSMNEPTIIEINPLAGLHPEDGDLVILSKLKGISYQELITNILDSAITRIR